MKRLHLGRRLRYAFDNTLARGPSALILWLALATAVLIATAFAVDILIGGVSVQQGLGVRQVFWNLLFQALVPNPPGNLDSPWQFMVVMLAVTLASLAMVSILIGLLSATIQNRVERLRRGRSQVIEGDHTVILGWSEQIFPIISELCVAHEHQHHVIAILGDVDQVEMEDEIRHRISSTGRTHVVCRRGTPIEHADLDLVSPQTSRSIIVLPGDDPSHPDVSTIKTMLALTKAGDRRAEPYRIVGVIREPANMSIARMVGGDEVEIILSGDVIARIIAQTSRQPGLSVVYSELLDFSGDEIHFCEEPALVGTAFGKALSMYEDSALIGILRRDGTPLLCPAMDTVIQAGDQVIAISEDDDTVHLSDNGLQSEAIQREAIVTQPPASRSPERTLILGWNWRGPIIARQLDAYVQPGSAITIVARHDALESDTASLNAELRNQEVRCQAADTASRAVLDSLQIHAYDHVIVLCYSDTMAEQQADAYTLVTLLHLRAIADAGGHAFTLVSEMMDVRNRNLAATARVDDFVVSDRLISLLMAQIAEYKALHAIFEDLFDPAGAEIFLKPATDYVQPGLPVSFYTVVEAACRRGEVAIGYRLHALTSDDKNGYGVVLNPDKSLPVTFASDDRIIVLAED